MRLAFEYRNNGCYDVRNSLYVKGWKDLVRYKDWNALKLDWYIYILVVRQAEPVNYRKSDNSSASVTDSYAVTLDNDRYFSNTFWIYKHLLEFRAVRDNIYIDNWFPISFTSSLGKRSAVFSINFNCFFHWAELYYHFWSFLHRSHVTRIKKYIYCNT